MRKLIGVALLLVSVSCRGGDRGAARTSSDSSGSAPSYPAPRSKTAAADDESRMAVHRGEESSAAGRDVEVAERAREAVREVSREAAEKSRARVESSERPFAPPSLPVERPVEPRVERPARRAPPANGNVKAGAADDNLQFNAFLDFLSANGHLAIRHDVANRVIISVRDGANLPVANARVSLVDDGVLAQRLTYADGRAMLFPSELPRPLSQSAKVRVDYRGDVKEVFLSGGKRTIEVKLDGARVVPPEVPLDIAFVLDTTGSMGDEIERLKQTLDTIHFQVSSLPTRPQVRFGMVLYRDHGDDYITKVVPFTSDVNEFAHALSGIFAGGGGDYPEDVQAGLRAAMKRLNWRDQGARLAFLIGDAPPHFDYGDGYTYVDAMNEAAARGIKIAAIGASGLTLEGEVVWRQIAQYTMSPFVFLTYGESGDSVGSPSSVSHHVGSNWVAENLDAIIVRMVKVELASFAPKSAPVREDYFEAASSAHVPSELVLDDLFGQSAKQLVDYAVERIEERTPTVVLPVSVKVKTLEKAKDKLENRLSIGLSAQRAFQLLEQKNMSELLAVTAKHLDATYDEREMIRVGKLVPAKLAVISQVDANKSGNLEMLVKLVRLETGEVLSLSLLKIDRTLLN